MRFTGCEARFRIGRSIIRSQLTMTSEFGRRSTTTTGRLCTSSTRIGIIRDEFFGENGYDRSETTIQELLGIKRDGVSVVSTGIEAPADWEHLRSPETYLGFERNDQFASPGPASRDERRHYELPEQLRLNQWALSGDWVIAPEKAMLEVAGGSIAIRFEARDANLVLSHETDEPIAFRVTLDGEAPGLSHGIDVDEEGNGVIQKGRLYQLIRQKGEVLERTLEVSFLQTGARGIRGDIRLILDSSIA